MDPQGIELITAAATGVIEMAKDCLQRGVSVHAGNDLALRTAALMGNADMVRFLVDSGADVRASHSEALYYAARRGDEKTVEFLVSKGADVADMTRHFKKDLDADALALLDRHASKQQREVFEKNLGKLRKPPKGGKKGPKP